MKKGFILMSAETRLTENSDKILARIFPDGFEEEQQEQYYKLTGVSPLMDEAKGNEIPQYHFRVAYEGDTAKIIDFKRA